MSTSIQFNYGEKASDAVISACQAYRYALTRVWDADKPYVMFVGLNPSTADAVDDDPTIRRCIGFAQSWGYGGLVMANLFAYRATEPHVMMSAGDPVGPDNDDWLTRLGEKAGVVVAAWGNDGAFLNRSSQVHELLPNLHYLKMNKSGEPAHPLYLKATLTPTAWEAEHA
ncbi:DUF1643 domain-containing protein [Ferrimonas sp. YFM]|uniref:DUF1643 domain-containing protein n=1 Tax=Ferrimonas sp. YFM TaxID=3028878 RepID=UPI00257372A5|nr:DUF1643 domain-containing protein [Ferrimonas sp. YFM]BDY04689.1 hypothetical protein F0521_17300 [Ferrimonas sp. YFM]